MLRAWYSRRAVYSAGLFISAVFSVWLVRHALQLEKTIQSPEGRSFYWIYLFTFISAAVTMLLAHANKKPKKLPENEYVVAIVPCYNEDSEVLAACIESLLQQTRKPNEIYVIDDGSTTSDYTLVKTNMTYMARLHNVQLVWHKKVNGGKRHAQAVALQQTPYATMYLTVDSDSIVDPNALTEMLAYMGNKKVQSVAGIILAKNNTTNLLARFTDLLFVVGQLTDRSAMSAVGSVLVNSGGLALYRAALVQENMQLYLHESFFGNHIEFSDDSMLTLFALRRGKTVQCNDAFAFTMMPDNVRHHIRQQLRWSKGSFIRSWWRIKYLPLLSFGFIRQAIGWLQFTSTTMLALIALVLYPIEVKHLYIAVLLMPLFIGATQALRYLTIKRSDEHFLSQLATFSLAPLAIIWAYLVLRPLRWYAIATCFKTSWGTRKKVEVTLQEKQPNKANIFSQLSIFVHTVAKNMSLFVATKFYKAQYKECFTQEQWFAHYNNLPNYKQKLLWWSYDIVKRYSQHNKFVLHDDSLLAQLSTNADYTRSKSYGVYDIAL